MLDDSLVQQLKSAHGNELQSLEIAGKEFVFRKPKRLEFERWFDSREGRASQSALELAISTVVYPNAQEFRAAIDDKPGALMGKGGVLDILVSLAGLGEDVQTKKL